MGVIFIMLPLAIVLAGVAIFGFCYAVRRGQFDDLETPPWRAMFDDDK